MSTMVAKQASKADRSKGRIGRNISLIITYFIVVLFTALIGYPILWVVLQSFKTMPEMFMDAWAMPQNLLWENYQRAIEISNILVYARNSIFVSVTAVIFILILSSTASYAFSKFNFAGRNILFYIFVFSLMLPVPIIPLFSVIVNLGLMNSHWALIWIYTSGGLPFSIFMLKSFFDGIPKEIEEAAFIDGCPHYLIYARIIMPLAKPGLATVVIFQFMGAWNEFFNALIFVRRSDMRTIPIGMQAFFIEFASEWPALFATLTMTIIPVLLVYAIMQKQFIEGLTAGATKL